MKRKLKPAEPGDRLRHWQIVTVCLLLTLGSWSLARGDGQPARRKDVVELTHCRVEFSQSTFLGSSQPGVMKECLVRVGERVEEGQILGRLRNADVLAEFDLREITNESFLPIELAEARRLLAETNLLRAKGISKRGYLSDADLRKAECEAQIARLEVDTAKQQKQMAEVLARQAKAMIHFRELVSPHQGIVLEIQKTPGESVTTATSVYRIVDDTKMKVVGQLDVVDCWRVHVGQAVRAWPTIPGVDLPVEREMFEGHVIQVENQIDPVTNTSKIVVEIENRENLLRAGLEARIEIDLNSDTTISIKSPAVPQFRETALEKQREPEPKSEMQKK